MSSRIPLSEPHMGGNEWVYIKECLDTGWVSSAGKYVDLFETRVAEYTGARHAIACVNGTAALQVAMQLAGVRAGDEVIVPTITFIASINAVLYNGATPVFMDADDFYNIDVAKTIEFIKNETLFKGCSSFNKTTNKRIAALVPVHVFGNAVDLEKLISLCEERNIPIVEDAAESLGTRYTQGRLKERHTGTIGKLGCLSFNGNKIITTGGGGMILTDDDSLAEKARYLTTQAKDDAVRYIHDEVGYNYRLTNIQAAMGVAQLEQLPGIMNAKHQQYENYARGISALADVSMASRPGYANNNNWMPALRIETDSAISMRETLMSYLEKEQIQTRPLWYPNHKQEMYRNCQSYQIKRSIQLWEQTLCLPSYQQMEEKQINQVVDSISTWHQKQTRLQG
ncbi:MAG: LegC family aminotransferase [Candidatus Marinimicrobia bacterium]|nr:LegC family aminotransferase [Candidatus Neomarinimicrobiota bacterium]MBT4033411.1 LegC family aminotransferase [Candidatus Neomarinimicrobiota bacterium]